MSKKIWRKIACLMLSVAIIFSLNTQAIAVTMEDFELDPKESVIKSDVQVQSVTDMIDAIGAVEYSDDCLGKIVVAENAYDALKSQQKEQVLNYGKLLSARSGYNALAADQVDTSGYTITDSGTINDTVEWYVYDNGVLEVAGTGSVPSYSSDAPWQSYVSSINTIIVRSSISGIGASAFSSCNNVTSITLPFVGASRDATGWQAHFGYIFGYSTKTTQAHNGAATGTSNKAVTLYTTDGSSYNMTITVTRYYSSGTTTFINGAVDNSSKPWYSCQNGYYDYEAYGNTYRWYNQIQTYYYNVPTSLNTVNITDATKIEDAAFNNCKNITSISLNDSLSSVGAYAFQSCALLNGFAIPNDVTTIGEYAFYCDASLTEMYIPDGVTIIEPYTFCGCSNLSRLCISRDATSIGSRAFYGCSALPKIVIPNSVTSISDGAFAYCTGATSVIISENTVSIGSEAFQGCTNLTAINIPDKVASLGAYAFSGDNNVTSLSIGSGVRTIPSYAFEDCTGLTEITVPDSVTAINEFAFSGCNNVTSITLPFVGASRNATGWQAHFGYIFGYSKRTTKANNGAASGTSNQTVTLYKTDGSSYSMTITVTRNYSTGTTTFINGSVDGSYATYYPWYSCQNGYYDCDVYGNTYRWYNQIQTYYYNVPTSLNTVNITDATKIEDAAFNNCKNITSM